MSAFISFLEKIGLIFYPTVQQEFYSNGEPFYVSFEGLGIGKFKVNPVAIPIGNGIRFYGIIITAAIVFAGNLAADLLYGVVDPKIRRGAARR